MEILNKLRRAVGLTPRHVLEAPMYPNPLRQLRKYLAKGNPALKSGRQWVWYRKYMKREKGIDLKVMARVAAAQARRGR